MHADYDPVGDVLTVHLAEGEVARTIEVDPEHLVDLAEDGTVLAFELLDPDTGRLASLARDFGLSDRLDEIRAVIDAQLPQRTRPGTLVASYSFTAAKHYPLQAPMWVDVAWGRTVPSAPVQEIPLALTRPH
jgi:uncharacterized protein YuzE